MIKGMKRFEFHCSRLDSFKSFIHTAKTHESFPLAAISIKEKYEDEN